MVYYRLDDHHIVGLLAQGLDHVRGRQGPGALTGPQPSACTVCEVHAESTFKVEGIDCREEVALLERRFKHLAGLEAFRRT